MEAGAKKRLTAKEWADIKIEYATTSISFRKLAEKYGQSFNTLKDRATREHWTEEKERYRQLYTKKTQQNLAQARARACARDLKKLGMAAGNISGAIRKILKDSEQFKRYIITEGLGGGETKVEERIFEKIDTKAIRDIAGTMKDLAFVLRDVYGQPQVVEQSAMDIALQRLMLDKEQANKGEGVKEMRVIIEDHAGVTEGKDVRNPDKAE